MTQFDIIFYVVELLSKCLPNMATVLQPLNELLQKNKKGVWSSICDQAFDDAKKMLLRTKLLTHYNESSPLKLATDASLHIEWEQSYHTSYLQGRSMLTLVLQAH